MPITQSREVTAAKRLDNVRYAIRDLACVADEVIKQGHKVLPLNLGDPLNFDFQTPPDIIDAVHRAMRDGKNGYAPSPGVPEALDAIRGEAVRKGISTVQDVFVTSGVSETVDLCISALVDPGENILTPRPRGLVLINPNNPTGSLCSRQMLEQIAELARRHNLVVFSDEIYDKLILEDTPHIAFAAVAPDVPCITFGGMSKNYLVPGWRIGWGIVSGDAAALKSYTEGIHRLLRARLCANHPEQYAIKPALEGPQDHLVEVRSKLRSRRDLTQRWCEATPRVSCVAPRGAFYAFPRIDIPESDIAESDEVFVKELIRQKHVMVVHGSGFGQKPGTQHFRIVFLPDEKTLTSAYAAIGDFIRERYPTA